MFTEIFLKEASETISKINVEQINIIANLLGNIKNTQKGRLFIIGVGGSAGNAAHAVNDFRKIDNFEAYTPTDNISELTARINDDGWESVFVNWLKVSKLKSKDGILILSVGGGNIERKLSINLLTAAEYGKEIGASIFAIVGIEGGEIIKITDSYILIPTPSKELITPITEGIQSLILHLLVSHPSLRENITTW